MIQLTVSGRSAWGGGGCLPRGGGCMPRGGGVNVYKEGCMPGGSAYPWHCRKSYNPFMCSGTVQRISFRTLRELRIESNPNLSINICKSILGLWRPEKNTPHLRILPVMNIL